MIRVKWELEEAVALYELYFRFGGGVSFPQDEVAKLSFALKKRAEKLALHVDEKFRNVVGLNMQLACIHFVVTGGKEGLSGVNKLFYQTYALYQTEPEKFHAILKDFNTKYAD